MTREQLAKNCAKNLANVPDGAAAAGMTEIITIILEVLNAILPVLQRSCPDSTTPLESRSSNPRRARRFFSRHTRRTMGLADYRENGGAVVESLMTTPCTPEELQEATDDDEWTA